MQNYIHSYVQRKQKQRNTWKRKRMPKIGWEPETNRNAVSFITKPCIKGYGGNGWHDPSEAVSIHSKSLAVCNPLIQIISQFEIDTWSLSDCYTCPCLLVPLFQRNLNEWWNSKKCEEASFTTGAAAVWNLCAFLECRIWICTRGVCPVNLELTSFYCTVQRTQGWTSDRKSYRQLAVREKGVGAPCLS